MVRPLKARKVTVPKKKVPREKQTATPIVWYGGKSRDGAEIISNFPPHDTFVDVFGGGGAITFLKDPSVLDVYNDIGNVSNFYRILRDYGEELYESLYLTPYSREEFEDCVKGWRELSNKAVNGIEKLDVTDQIEWARAWYVSVMQSFTHEERAKTWKNSKTMDLANTWNTHVEDLPRFIERLRKIYVEHRDFMEVLKLYDSEKTLFYLDPPYLPETRTSQNNYENEMPLARHKEMLRWLNESMKGQAVVSMYAAELYDTELSKSNGWRRLTIEHISMIRNSSGTVGTRTEVIWIKEHNYGLWSFYYDEVEKQKQSSANVAGLSLFSDQEEEVTSDN